MNNPFSFKFHIGNPIYMVLVHGKHGEEGPFVPKARVMRSDGILELGVVPAHISDGGGYSVTLASKQASQVRPGDLVEIYGLPPQAQPAYDNFSEYL